MSKSDLPGNKGQLPLDNGPLWREDTQTTASGNSGNGISYNENDCPFSAGYINDFMYVKLFYSEKCFS